MKPSDGYLSSAAVRARYGGCSDMTLWRWLSDDELCFPKPLRVQRRRLWRLAELEAWERERRTSADANPA